MNLGFDFDKIFINYPPFVPSFLIDRLYKKQNKNLSYRIPKKYEQFFRIATHYPLLRPVLYENVAWIRNLSKNKRYNCYLISSRFGFLEKTTQRLIEKHQFDKIFRGLHFNFQNEQPHIFKNKKIRNLKIDRYVDDDLQLLEHLVSKNSNIAFFWLNNKHQGKMKKNLFAITKLSSIIEKYEHI